MRRFTAGSTCSKCTGVLRAFAPGVLVCSRNGNHIFEATPAPATPPKARPRATRTIIIEEQP